MELRVLGPVRATVDGSEVALGGPRQRRLLAALVIGGGRAVSVHRLVEAVWGDEPHPPAGASRSVLSYVSRLRSALGDGYVATREGGYALAPDVVVDATEFERRLGDSRDARLTEASRLLDEALALWRGRAFDDLADEDWCRPAAVQLEELRLVALEGRGQARLDLGRHVDAIAELETLVVEEPLRESFRAQLMVALYRSGRQADALRSFQQYRRLLGDEIGLEPSRDLVELDHRIAVADPSLQFVTEGRTKRGYVLAEVLGEGSFGTVYRAIQPAVGRDVAVKVVRPAFADDPDFVRRFEGEARLVARLEHPHIVPLYDYWREPANGAYLVMRYLRGGNLTAALGAGERWPVARVSRFVEEIGSALAVAHGAGVVHGDVTPANVLFDELANAYLTDFGIATEAVPGVAPVGRSAEMERIYSSPEQARDGLATPLSDQYALAALARELLMGSQPGQAASSLETVLRRATSAEPADRFASMADLLASWEAAVAADGVDAAGRAAASDLPLSNPYKGLRAFDEADAHDFFGREASVDRLVTLVREQRLTFVVGPSGSGKSSLVRAGLMPRLRDGGSVVTVAIPGAFPIDEIAGALLRVAVRRPADLRGCLVDPVALAGTIEWMLAADGRELVLVLDQLEELWTLVDPVVRDRLLDALVGAAVAPGSRMRIVATVRADFYDRPLAHPAIGPFVEVGTYPVAPLTASELSAAMSRPAASAGVHLEPALVAELTAAAAAEPASLPLLQFTLTELFEHRDGATMTLGAYQAMGGLGGALVGRAEAIYAAQPDVDRPAVRRLFRRLVSPGEGAEDTRRRARRSELTGVPGAIIDHYGAARLLTFDVEPVTREPTVEVAHEALIRHWPRLRAWVDEDRDGLRVHRHLTGAAAAWAGGGRDAAELYRGARLHSASEWAGRHPEELAPAEASFLAQSQRQARKAHRRAVSAVALLAALLVLAVIGAGLALKQRQRADANAANAQQSATDAAEAAAREASARTDADLRRLSAEAQATAVSQPDLAMLLAVEAYRRRPGAQSEGALEAALATQPVIRRFLDAALPAGKTVRSMAASRELVAFELDGSVTLRDAVALRPVGVTIETGLRSRVALNPSGTELATSTGAGQIRRWDPRTGRELGAVLQVQPTATYGIEPPIDYLADGSLVVADSGVLRIVSPGAAAPDREVTLPGAPPVAAISVNRTGGVIAVAWLPAPNAGGLGLIDTAGWSLRVVPWTLGPISAVRFAGEQRLYVGTYRGDLSGSVAVVDPGTGSVVAPVGELVSAATNLVALDDGGGLATLASGGLAHIRADGHVGPRIELRGQVPLARLMDGTILGVSSGRLIELDPSGISLIGHELRSGGTRVEGLLAGTADRLLLQGAGGAMTVVDSSTLRPVGPPLVATVPAGPVSGISMSPDGALVAVSSGLGVEVLDVALGRARRPPIPFGTFGTAPFSPDGRAVLIGGLDGKVHAVDVTTQVERWSQGFGGEQVAGVAWSGDGRLVTARTFRGDARILDAATGADLTGPLNGVANISFSPTSAMAVTTGSELRVIDQRTGETIRTFPGTGGFFLAVFVREGRWISAMTGSGLVELFDIDSGTRIGVPLRVADDAVSDLRRSVIVPDGLYWGAPDSPVVFYDLDPARWAETACRAAGRNLTRTEWEQYLGSLGAYRATCPQYPEAA